METNLEGEITEILIKGDHNHPRPQNARRSASSSVLAPIIAVEKENSAGSLREEDADDEREIKRG